MTPSRTPLYVEGLLAPGDSGGGLFTTADDGKRYLAGVNSFVGASLFLCAPPVAAWGNWPAWSAFC